MSEQQVVQALHGIVDIQKAMVLGRDAQTVGSAVVESDAFREFKSGKSDMARVEVKTAIVSTGAANDPLRHYSKPYVDVGVRRGLNLRSVLPSYPTTEGMIELPVKTAATYGSPIVQSAENTAFGESAFTFTNTAVQVATLGHFQKVSKQAMNDSAAFRAFIDGEMLHGLQLAVENQLLNGDGTAGQLTGLLDNATAYSLRSPNLSGASVIRDAMRQVEGADFTPSHIVLHSDDWYSLDVAQSADARTMTTPTLWGLPVICTNSIASGAFLVGDMARCGAIFERETAEVSIATADDDDFRKNMLAVKAEERLALVITNSAALVKGSL
jgi:HK97 family phage major capsid protein